MNRFENKFLNGISFTLVWIILWESQSMILLMIYLQWGLSLFGEEDETEKKDELETEEIISNVKSYTDNYVEVLQDANFFNFYYNQNLEIEGELALDIDDHNKYEFDRENMIAYLTTQQKETRIKIINNIIQDYILNIFNNNVLYNWTYNFNLIFLDLNILAYYKFKKFEAETDIIAVPINVKSTKINLIRVLHNSKQLYLLLFRSPQQLHMNKQSINHFYIKNSLPLSLHTDNTAVFLKLNKYNYFDTYLLYRKKRKELFDWNIRNDTANWKEHMLSLLETDDADILSERYDIRGIYSNLSKFYFYDLSDDNRVKRNQSYQYNYGASYLNLSFIKLPWQKK